MTDYTLAEATGHAQRIAALASELLGVPVSFEFEPVEGMFWFSTPDMPEEKQQGILFVHIADKPIDYAYMLLLAFKPSP